MDVCGNFLLLLQISNNALRLEDLLEALVDVCNLKNVSLQPSFIYLFDLFFPRSTFF